MIFEPIAANCNYLHITAHILITHKDFTVIIETNQIRIIMTGAPTA